MKKIILIGVAAILALSTVSCVESSSKYKAVVAEKDSLQSEMANLVAEYNETLDIINDIESCFAAIRESEGKLMIDLSSIERPSSSKKQRIASQMKQIQDIFVENKAKIEQLQSKVSEMEAFKKTIVRLESELKEQSSVVASLQKELKKKNIKIKELTGLVEQLDKNLESLYALNELQREELVNYDANLNKAWYCIADEKALKEAQIVTKTGLFSKELLNSEFNKDVFKQIDLRTVSTIETGAKKVKILTSHPTNSYSIETGEDGNAIIKILSQTQFWSVSKYLVVKK